MPRYVTVEITRTYEVFEDDLTDEQVAKIFDNAGDPDLSDGLELKVDEETGFNIWHSEKPAF